MPGLIPFVPPASTAAVLPTAAKGALIVQDENGAIWVWNGTNYALAGSGGTGSGSVIDGGFPDSNYGGTTAIDGGTP